MAEPAQDLPTGTVTFLFTDVEGSTRVLQQTGDAWPAILERHAALIRDALSRHAGLEVSTEGDAFFAVFASARDAIAAAADAQRALAAESWPAGATVRVRMGLHTGEGRLGGDNYAGLDVHRAARIAAAAHGGQVLLSDATRAVAGADLPPGVGLADIGVHHLKDLDAPERLYQAVVDELPRVFPPPRARRAGNLPSPATSFVGRDAERAALRELVARERLVTVVGPGGAGKTRLALQVAAELADGFADGAFFVPLDAIAEPELVPSAVLRALDVADAGGAPLDRLREHLAGRSMLLLLDNFEQILPAATTVDALRSAGPDMRILVTSRAPLGLYGEQQFPVPPLSSPDPAALPSLDRLSQYEAVALFVARARAVRPDFEVTSENAPAVAEICARLDGLPLAIELAAARVGLLPPEAIVRRLGARLQLLGSPGLDRPERQRTLRGAIAWSYELLSEPDRRIFARLGVFSGGAGLEAIEQVVDPDARLGRDVLDAVAALVANSLLRQRERRGEPRFLQLETIREFALERLAELGEADEVRARHAAWVRALVEAAEPTLGSSGPDGSFERVTAEYDNVRAALRWSLDAARLEDGLAIVGAVWRWWQRTGLLVEGRWWCDELLRHPGSASRIPERAKALSALGSVAYWQGDLDVTCASYEESLAIARELGDARGIAWGSFNLAFCALIRGDVETSRRIADEALARFRAIGDEIGAAEALFVVGYTEVVAGNVEAALPPLKDALDRVSGDPRRRADALVGIGQAYRRMGDTAAARAAFEESAVLSRVSRDVGLLIGSIEMLAVLELDAERLETGARVLGAARALRKETGGGPPVALMLLGEPLERARETLGGERMDALIAEGERLSLDEALDLVGVGQAAAAAPEPP